MIEKAFLCHSSADSEFVCQVASFLRPHMSLFYYEEHQQPDEDFVVTYNRALRECDAMIVFVGNTYGESEYQKGEVQEAARRIGEGRKYSVVIVPLEGSETPGTLPSEFPQTLKGYPCVKDHYDSDGRPMPVDTAIDIVSRCLKMEWRANFGLPVNPHLFSYEKDIIEFFSKRKRFDQKIFQQPANEDEARVFLSMGRKLRDGCPADWPRVVDLTDEDKGVIQAPREGWPENHLLEEEIGFFRPRTASVAATALRPVGEGVADFDFPEAGPRADLVFPLHGNRLNVGIVVSGGIAPGINSVIDGIVQRHWKYAGADEDHHNLAITGFMDGFYAFERRRAENPYLIPNASYRKQGRPEPTLTTSNHATSGGSILGTFRLDKLIDRNERGKELAKIVTSLSGIDILYIIGGDGSMKAAHALWSAAQEDSERDGPLSVVAIPKTMDNDILWVWQSFGFLSAVEKARETIELIYTEVKSNPRLCVLQMFGSDSGFVVSHAILASAAGQCDLALIPEVSFSMIGIARYLKDIICRQKRTIPYALVVMAETAIPVDVAFFLKDEENPPGAGLRDEGLTGEEKRMIEQFNPKWLGLEPEEAQAIREFDRRRWAGQRIEGQTSDELRRAGLKIVQRGLPYLLEGAKKTVAFKPKWGLLRRLANEPRHLLRAIPPSTTDIIMGQRLGMLAVDNAMAGYTDFMISQWLTEFVLVPLELVVLGRKRIPESGIFWKSVLAKTSQPSNLVAPWAVEEKSGGPT